ncbi:hypothetical protein PIIN_11572 [Serendipita indica DSM 11827]|uniref:Uncharacterized protein n=1 Tax=Serendipita indica (strain DSM 11827) TaxID=1109443 RepID=G4U202_SERID|nr:hypothetical protein PIIN_11572 [Serendipita indica DSM 11827]
MRVTFFAVLFASAALLGSAAPVPEPSLTRAQLQAHHQAAADHHLTQAEHHLNRAETHSNHADAAHQRFVHKLDNKMSCPDNETVVTTKPLRRTRPITVTI